MRVTMDLPDELLRGIRTRGAQKRRSFEDVVTDLLRRELERAPGDEGPPATRRVRLPLVPCTHPALPGEEMTPERVGEILYGEGRG